LSEFSEPAVPVSGSGGRKGQGMTARAAWARRCRGRSSWSGP